LSWTGWMLEVEGWRECGLDLEGKGGGGVASYKYGGKQGGGRKVSRIALHDGKAKIKRHRKK
jgi:hypothetical protein